MVDPRAIEEFLRRERPHEEVRVWIELPPEPDVMPPDTVIVVDLADDGSD